MDNEAIIAEVLKNLIDYVTACVAVHGYPGLPDVVEEDQMSMEDRMILMERLKVIMDAVPGMKFSAEAVAAMFRCGLRSAQGALIGMGVVGPDYFFRTLL